MPAPTWIEVSGESMRPMLAPGDRVLVEWAEQGARPRRVGEIVLIRDEAGAFLLHRVIRSDGRTKGDYSSVVDGRAPGGSWGRIVALRPANGPAAARGAALETGGADRLIARLSLLSVQARPWRLAKPVRAAQLALGAARRWSLLWRP